jgi:hypothetical protein
MMPDMAPAVQDEVLAAITGTLLAVGVLVAA